MDVSTRNISTMTAEQLASQRSPSLELGPNGYPVEYTESGDKVEWIPSQECFCDEDCPGKHCANQQWANVLVRGEAALQAAHAEYRDKAWWNRHQNWVRRISAGIDAAPQGSSKASFDRAQFAAKRIEAKYGRDTLACSDFELGVLNGRLSALAWVLGSEWEDSLDT